MPDFLTTSFASGPAVSPVMVLVRLVAALLFGGVVLFIYRRTRLATEITPSFPPTLVLLSILIAMVTQVVGDSPSRAFALVGALSIVRFRTVVRDTQDTAYVIFAVVVGMGAGAAELWVAVIGTGVVAVAALIMKPRGSSMNTAPGLGSSYVLNLRVGLGHDLKALVGGTLDRYLKTYDLREIGTARQGIAIDVSYDVQLRESGAADEIVKALNRIEGVQSVELQRADVIKDEI
jgi:uncharacterized membrane protein YhiD involved in acid resistance